MLHSFLILAFLSSSFSPAVSAHPKPHYENNELCAICLDPLNSEQTIETSCQHSFHKSCFKDYIGTKTQKHITQYLFHANKNLVFSDQSDCTYECPLCRSHLSDHTHRDQFKFPRINPNPEKSKLIFWYNGRFSGEIKRKWLTNKSEKQCSRDVELIWQHIDKT